MRGCPRSTFPGAATLPAGDTRTEGNLSTLLTWGNTQTACLGNYVWEDRNANGLQDDGATGINGVTVTLLADTDNDGQVDDFVASMLTGDDLDTTGTQTGYYKFCDLMPGEQYQVVFTNPDAVGGDRYFFSPANQGANDAIDSDAVPNAGQTLGTSQVVTLTSGQYNDTIDAGLYRNGSIHAFGFLDVNGNGVQDGGDNAFPDVPGKTFQLTGPGGTQTVTTTSGRADWVSLTPGSYTIQESPVPSGYALTTTPNARTFTVLSGQELVYTPGAAELPAGDTRTEVNLSTLLTWGNTTVAPPSIDLIKLVRVNNSPDRDANVAPYPVAEKGDTITFTYLVKNTGAVPLSIRDANGLIRLIDDNATPGNTADDFRPAQVLSAGFNVGDLDKDNVLDPGETWSLTASETALGTINLPASSVMSNYLMIGTTSNAIAKAVNVQNGDLGANVIMLSDEINDNVDVNTRSVFERDGSTTPQKAWFNADNIPNFTVAGGNAD